MAMQIEVNRQTIDIIKDEYILDALKRNGIRVPTLCHMKDFTPTGSCRLCVVEIEGEDNLITACSQPVREGMKITTHSTRVLQARKTIVELLLASHPDDCLYCQQNNDCELQDLASELKIRERRMPNKKIVPRLDLSSPAIGKDASKCVLCGRCIRICEEKQQVSAFDFINKGSETQIAAAYNKNINFSSCITCGQCIVVCPTGALFEKENINETIEALNNPNKFVVVQYAPSLPLSLAEELNLKPGKDYTGLLNLILQRMGFERIYDISFAADVAIMEMGHELADRMITSQSLPMMSSFCPAWVKYIEQFKPELINHLSVIKSPQQIMGSIIKNHLLPKENIESDRIISVSIMPCTANKYEAQREEMANRGAADIDIVITTREFIRMIKVLGIDVASLQELKGNLPTIPYSSSGKLFATAGGLTEGLIRSLSYFKDGKEIDTTKLQYIRSTKEIREIKTKLVGKESCFMVLSGMTQIKKLFSDIESGRKDLIFAEVTSCQGGCFAGAGQCNSNDETILRNRMKTLYSIDENETINSAHKNPSIRELYDTFLINPLGEKSKRYLHTKYAQRDVLI